MDDHTTVCDHGELPVSDILVEMCRVYIDTYSVVLTGIKVIKGQIIEIDTFIQTVHSVIKTLY